MCRFRFISRAMDNKRKGWVGRRMVKQWPGELFTLLRNLMLSSAAKLSLIKRMQNSFLFNGEGFPTTKRRNFSLNAFLLHPVKLTKFDIIMSLTLNLLDANHKRRLKPFVNTKKLKVVEKLNCFAFLCVKRERWNSSLPLSGFTSYFPISIMDFKGSWEVA